MISAAEQKLMHVYNSIIDSDASAAQRTEQYSKSKSQELINEIAQYAIEYLDEAMKTQENPSLGVSTLNREDRAALKERIHVIRPDLAQSGRTLIIKKGIGDMFVSVELQVVPSITVLEPSREYWQQIADKLEGNFHNGEATHDLTGELDYDKQEELLEWLKINKPNWEASIKEVCFAGEDVAFPGKMGDLLIVKKIF